MTRHPFGHRYVSSHRAPSRSPWRPVVARLLSTVITLAAVAVALLLLWGATWWVVAALAAGYLLGGVPIGLAVGRAIHHRDAQGPGTDRTPGGSDEH